jgi:hypothetical protein
MSSNTLKIYFSKNSDINITAKNFMLHPAMLVLQFLLVAGSNWITLIISPQSFCLSVSRWTSPNEALSSAVKV